VGIVGPVTNSAGNEQMIPAHYSSIEELERFAEQRLKDFEGRYFEIESLAMFCVVFRRRLFDEIGLLDERFGLGTFEDDDFCYKARLRGYKLICAEDVFVYHFGPSITRTWEDRECLELYEYTRRSFERKWSRQKLRASGAKGVGPRPPHGFIWPMRHLNSDVYERL
jgi:GT2 family glycosyltransferase